MRLSVRGIERERERGPTEPDQAHTTRLKKERDRNVPDGSKSYLSRKREKARGGGGSGSGGGRGEVVEEVKLMIDLCGELLRRKRKRSLSVDGNGHAGGGKTRRRDCLRLQGHLRGYYGTGFYVLWSLDLLLGVECSAVFLVVGWMVLGFSRGVQDAA